MRVRRPRGRLGFPLVALVEDVADHLLGDVLQGQHPVEPAELVDDDRQLAPAGPQLLQGGGQRQRPGHDHRRGARVLTVTLPQRSRGTSSSSARPTMPTTSSTSCATTGNRECGLVPQEVDDVRQRRGGRHGVDVDARGHRLFRAERPVRQPALEQEGELLVERAALAGLVDDVLQVRGGGARGELLDRFDADRPQQPVGGGVEEADQRAGDREVDLRRAAQRAGQRDRAGDGEVLRRQLADDHLEDGREDEHEGDGDGEASRIREVGDAEQVGQRDPDEGLTRVPDQQGGDGDPELGAREGEGEPSRDVERAGGRGVALVGQLPQPVAVHRDVGELLGDEVAGREGEETRRGRGRRR